MLTLLAVLLSRCFDKLCSSRLLLFKCNPNLLQALSFCNAGKPASCPLQHSEFPSPPREGLANPNPLVAKTCVDSMTKRCQQLLMRLLHCTSC
jgi:hypothetical protein